MPGLHSLRWMAGRDKPLKERVLLLAAAPWLVPRRVEVDAAAAGDAPWGRVEFESRDGTPLVGWTAAADDAVATVILTHGYCSSVDETLTLGDALWRRGYNTFTFDFRACGSSGGEYTGLGTREPQDLAAAIDLAAERYPGCPLAVHGFSMGASVAIMTAAADRRVRALSLDSPFATLSGAVDAHFKVLSHIPLPLMRLSQRAAEAILCATAESCRPVDFMPALSDRPLLFIHGGADDLVPQEHTLGLIEAHQGPYEAWLIDGVGHCMARFQHWDEYVRRVENFVRRAVRGPVDVRAR